MTFRNYSKIIIKGRVVLPTLDKNRVKKMIEITKKMNILQ